MGLFGKDDSNETRRVDGKPETAWDKKFFALREAGSKKPIDQDGNEVDDLKRWIREHS